MQVPSSHSNLFGQLIFSRAFPPTELLVVDDWVGDPLPYDWVGDPLPYAWVGKSTPILLGW